MSLRRSVVAFVVLTALSLGGCAVPATVSEYFTYRLHDLGDICNVEIGGGAGAFAELRVRRAPHLSVGMIEHTTKWAGLIDGKFGAKTAPSEVYGLPFPQVQSVLVTLFSGFPWSFVFALEVFVTKIENAPDRVEGKSGMTPLTILFIPAEGEPDLPATRATDVSAELSLLARIRLTMSPGEALDFFAGVFCLDIAGDDKHRSWRITPADDPGWRYELRHELCDAIKNDDIATVNRVLDRDPELINSRHEVYVDENVLAYAVQERHLKVARVFVERGVEVDPFSAATLDMTETVAEAIKDDPGLLNKVARHGGLLHYAAAGNATNVVCLLLQHRVDINAVSGWDGQTALQVAARDGAEEVAELLIKAGADLNIRDRDERTALGLARRNKKDRIAQLLLKHGARE